MSPKRRHPNVVNLDESDANELKAGTRISSVSRRLSGQTGARGVGCTHYEVPAGCTAVPRHFHCANEEALFVLDGKGELRMGDDRIELRAGDYVTLPTGPAHAHQLFADASGPMRYLCMSTLATTEVVGYPDSKKIGAMSSASYGDGMQGNTWVRHFSKEASSVAYFEGEDVG